MKLTLAGLSRFDFFGVLLLRIGVGALTVFHGFPSLLGGRAVWTEIGQGAAIAQLNPSLYFVAGLVACLAQVFGGVMLVLGLFTRGTALCLTIAASFPLANLIAAQNFELAFFAHLQIALVFFSLVFIGPGRVSLDRKGI